MSTHNEPSGYGEHRSLRDPLLRFNEVCALLVVSRKTLYEIIAAGELTPIRVGRRQRFAPTDVHAYLERNREAVLG